VRFTRLSGNGTLTGGDPGASPNERLIGTGPDGVASCNWAIDSATQVQQVMAELLDDQGQRVDVPVLFHASLSRASEVRYEPGNCPSLAGADTVQKALDRLSHITALEKLGGDGQLLAPGETPEPLRVRAVNHCGAPIDAGTVRFEVVLGGGVFSNGQPTMDVPLANGQAAVAWTLGSSPETQWVTATLTAAASGGQALPVREPRPQVWFSGTPTRPAGGGCSVVVSADESIEELLKGLIEQGERDLCLCLTVGEHKLSGDFEAEAADVTLKLTGCGAGTRVFATSIVRLSRFASVLIRDLELILDGDEGLVLDGCRAVALEACHVRRTSPGRYACTVAGAQRIRVQDCVIDAHTEDGDGQPVELVARILSSIDRRVAIERAERLAAELAGSQQPRAQLAQAIAAAGAELGQLTEQEQAAYQALQNALALDDPDAAELLARLMDVFDAAAHATASASLVLADAEAHAEISGNELVGALCIYGEPGRDRPLSRNQLKRIRAALGGGLTLSTGSGSLHVRDNVLTRFAVSEEMLKLLEAIADGLQAGRISGLHPTAEIVGNVFRRSEHKLVAENVTFTADRFASHGAGAHAAVVAGSVIVASSHAAVSAVVVCATVTPLEAANKAVQLVNA
jgi:hypothetical protein